MKTVNLNPKPEVSIQDLTPEHIIGFRTAVSGQTKGFVSRTNFNYGGFRLLANKHISNGNGWSTYQTFDEVKTFFRKSACEVIVFDDERELFLWLAEPVS